MKKYKVASLFSGIGGIDIGFINAGFDIVFANEIDSEACKTYRNNLNPSCLIEENIRNLDVASMPYFDVLVAGFPCQPFSIAGKQKGFLDERGDLFFQIIRENVANLKHHDQGKTLEVMLTTIENLGYKIKYKLMSAIDYGDLPQTRNRIYIMAFLNDDDYEKFEFPSLIKLSSSTKDIINRSDKKTDWHYYNDNSKMSLQLKNDITDPFSIYQIRDNGINIISNNLCPTLTANMGTFNDRVPVILDDYGVRKLTVKECLTFQGFPKNFSIPNDVSIYAAYKQIGNSVCISVIKRIAINLLFTISSS